MHPSVVYLTASVLSHCCQSADCAGMKMVLAAARLSLWMWTYSLAHFFCESMDSVLGIIPSTDINERAATCRPHGGCLN